MTINTWDNVNEPNFKRGRQAAQAVFAAEGQPNWDLINRADPRMKRGFELTWTTLITGGRV